MIVVGATTSSDALASFANRGSFVDLTAPGQGVRTTNDSGGYSNVSGTSFACPMTAGLCALIWSKNPSLTPQQVEDVLRMSCDDLGAAGVDDNFGFGRINSDIAMQMTPATSVGISFPVARPDEVSPAGGDTLDVIVTPGTSAAAVSAAAIAPGSGWLSDHLGLRIPPLMIEHTDAGNALGGELMFVGDDVPLGDGIGMGLRQSDTELRDTFDAVITEMKEDGSLNEMLKKWFGDDTNTYE